MKKRTVLLEDFLKINWYGVVAEKKENEKDQNGQKGKEAQWETSEQKNIKGTFTQIEKSTDKRWLMCFKSILKISPSSYS